MSKEQMAAIEAILRRAITIAAAECLNLPDGGFASDAADEAWDSFGLKLEADVCEALSARPDDVAVQVVAGMLREAMTAGSTAALGARRGAPLVQVADACWASVGPGYLQRLAGVRKP